MPFSVLETEMNNLPETRHSLLLRLAEPCDLTAWQDFLQTYEPVIMRLAMRRGLQLSDAQDLCQEVLTRVAKTAESWNPDSQRWSFRGWLTKVTRNLVVDHFRKQQRQPATPGETLIHRMDERAANVPPNELFDIEERRQIFLRAAESARSGFSQNTWSAFWKTCVENHPPQSAADQLGLSVGAVYIARSRVLAKIRVAVEGMDLETRAWRFNNAE